MRTSVFAFGAISLAASLAIATPASATSAVAVNGACSNLTDGVASSCHFSGNITTGTSGAASYHNTETAYNTYALTKGWPADLSLTPLASFNPGATGTANGISITTDPGSLSGTFTLAAGVDLSYYAVKAGNSFVLYEFGGGTGTFNWSTADLTVGNGQQPGLSHLVFFGTSTAGGVPEPATWAMMLLGIGMIGSGARRRRQKQARSLVLS